MQIKQLFQSKVFTSVMRFFQSLYIPPKMAQVIPRKVREFLDRYQVLRLLIRICGWCILALFPVYCFLMTEYIHYASKARFATFLLERGPVVLFSIGLFYLLWLCVLSICRKGWISTLVFGTAVSAVAFTNYMKHAMTGDYFYPWDALQVDKVGELTQFITVPFPILYTLLIAFIGVLTVIVYLSGASVPLKWYVTLPIVPIVIVCMYSSVSTPNKVTTLLNKNSLYLEDMALQTSNYSQNGFVGAFTINILSSNIQKPETYSEETVAALMQGHTASDAAEAFSSPDIILVLSESFWDPTLLPGTTFSEDPLKNYRALIEEDGIISGRFFTTGYGGGTVRPEFEVLTGLSTDKLPSGCVPWQYVTGATDSYVSIYRDLGYNTFAVHPYTSSFYNRKAAYPLIGIDAMYFEDTIYALGREGTLPVEIDGKQITDSTFVRALTMYLDQNTDSPNFVFGISMENHQPYPNKYESHEITVENPAFDENVQNAVLNFTKGVSHADEALAYLTDYVQNRDRDTILIWFGDHLPTLGTGMGAYAQSGMVAAYNEADYERLYSTPFVICANFDLQESTMLHEGKDNNITSYNLLNAVSQLIGSPRTPLMSYLESYYQTIPYYNVRLHKKVSDEAQQWINGHTILTYDIVAGERYINK